MLSSLAFRRHSANPRRDIRSSISALPELRIENLLLFLFCQSLSNVSQLLQSPPTTHASFPEIVFCSAAQRMSVTHTSGFTFVLHLRNIDLLESFSADCPRWAIDGHRYKWLVILWLHPATDQISFEELKFMINPRIF
jgi:hypothetical protein